MSYYNAQNNRNNSYRQPPQNNTYGYNQNAGQHVYGQQQINPYGQQQQMQYQQQGQQVPYGMSAAGGYQQQAYGRNPSAQVNSVPATPYSNNAQTRTVVAAVTKVHEKFCFIDNDIFCQLTLFRSRCMQKRSEENFLFFFFYFLCLFLNYYELIINPLFLQP